MPYEITKRQLDLYDYLSKQTDKVTKADIVANVKGYLLSDQTNFTHNILDDIKALNNNTSIEKVVIAKNSKFWIANSKEEAKEYEKHFYRCALKQFKHYWSINKKIMRDGQGKLDNTFWDSFKKDVMMETES